MSGAVFGVIEYTLDAKGTSTTVKLEHSAVGDISDETASNYKKGWTALLGESFKQFIELGKRPKKQ